MSSSTPKTFFLLGFSFFTVLLGVVFFLNKYQVQITEKPTSPITLPPQITGECGVSNCHGLDISCGKPVEMCDEMYQIGDKCRQFARCSKVNGDCQLVENPQFINCKTCALECEKQYPNDPEQAFICEGQCGE